MEALITSLAACLFEQSLVVAKEHGVTSWAVDQETNFAPPLDGYAPRAAPAGPQGIPRVVYPGAVTTEADQATVDAIHGETLPRCPVMRKFVPAGVNMKGSWHTERLLPGSCCASLRRLPRGPRLAIRFCPLP